MLVIASVLLAFVQINLGHPQSFQRSVTYCSRNSCDCFLVTVVESKYQQWAEDKCVERNMILLSKLHGISDSLDYFSIFLQTVHLPLDGDKVNVTCYIDFGKFDEHVLEKRLVWQEPICDGRTVDGVTVIRRCRPRCALPVVGRARNEHLAGKLLRHWNSGDIASTSGGCAEDAVQVVPCCRFTSSLSDSIQVTWTYNVSTPSIAVQLQCTNPHQRRVTKVTEILCKSAVALELPSCKFGKCERGPTLGSGALFTLVKSRVGTRSSHEVIKLSTALVNGLPTLLIICTSTASSVKDFQAVGCVYDKEVKHWEWKVSSLRQCLQPGQGLDHRLSHSHLTTIRIADSCFVLPHSTNTRSGNTFCAEFGGSIYKPHMPITRGTDSILMKALQPYGRKFWLGHSYTGNEAARDTTWLDGHPFFWNYTGISRTEYMALSPSDPSRCFVLDINEPDLYVLADCNLQLRELCYDRDLPSEMGKWSEWLEWTPCYNHVRRRKKMCSKLDSYCGGCEGQIPVQTEHCCHTRHSILHATATLIDTSHISVTCADGHKIGGTQTSVVYSCANNPDWQRTHNPVCIPDSCPKPPPPMKSSARAHKLDPGVYTIGSKLTYNCLPELVVAGSDDDFTSLDMFCLPNKTWSGQPPICIGKKFYYNSLRRYSEHVLWNVTIVLRTASKLVVAGRERKGDVVFAGDVIVVQCRKNYEFSFLQPMIGVNVTALGFVGMRRCKPYICEPPPRAAKNSHITSGRRAQTVGSSLTYQCLPGFIDASGHGTQLSLHCAANRSWVGGKMLNCTAASCPSLPDVVNGMVLGLNDYGLYMAHDWLQVVCNDSYGLKKGSKYKRTGITVCSPQGDWSSVGKESDTEYLECERVICPPITNLIKARVDSPLDHYYSGNSVTVRCFPQHVFVGSAMASGKDWVIKNCLEDGLWDGVEELHCYTYQLQFGPVVETGAQPGQINIRWLNTYLFQPNGLLGEATGDGELDGDDDGEHEVVATYTILFLGKDTAGDIRVNISLIHSAPRVQRIYSLETVVPPGFYYAMWISASIDSWSENSYGKPQALFYAPTGLPAFAKDFTIEDMTPTFENMSQKEGVNGDESVIEVQIQDVFSPVNGSVHQFNIIVIEMNEFLSQKYLQGTITDSLSTWASAQDYPYWPPYLIHEKCQLFTGAGCPDIASNVRSLHSLWASHAHKRSYTARDPIFKGDNAFVSSLSGANGMEELAITNDNLYMWTQPGHRQSSRVARYLVGGQNCRRDKKAVFCNGKLKRSSKYCIKLRAYTNDYYIDSPCAVAVNDSASLLVQWHRARILPLGFALAPVSFMIAVIAGVMLQSNSNENVEDPQTAKLRLLKRREKARARWRRAIFKAYEATLTTDNDQAVNLLAVASDEDPLYGVIERSPGISKSRRRLERKCSYFRKYRRWFKRLHLDSYKRAISFTALSEVDLWEEPYASERIVAEHHLPYHMYQEGVMVRRPQLQDGRRNPTSTSDSY